MNAPTRLQIHLYQTNRHPMIKKLTLALLGLSLSLTGCHRSSDAAISQKTIGTWEITSPSGKITFRKDGSYTSHWIMFRHDTSEELAYEGTWQIENRILINTVTNASGPEPHAPLGSTDRAKVISIDDHQLTIQ
ncbi:MAG TPA: lipocalin family protein, partial [Verrucomicrobiae bacterium]|nr:lipocalin family protein [Verrucomicrobiae bacterium]